MRKQRLSILMLFLVMLLISAAFAQQIWALRPHSVIVPDVPSKTVLQLSALGDEEAFYRRQALRLQEFGDGGGQVRSLKDYDYKQLTQWMFRLQDLSPRSGYLSFLAAYYFSGVQDNPEALRELIAFLAAQGRSQQAENWRWLAQAAFLARFRLRDQDLALQLADQLARQPGDLPIWARTMSSLIRLNIGETQAARVFIKTLLTTEKDNLHPNEVNYLVDLLETRLRLP